MTTTTIAVKPHVLRNALLTIQLDGETDDKAFQKHVSACALNPTTNVVKWRGMAPDAKFSSTSDPDWTLDVTFAQDWETTDSLSQFLLDHSGEDAIVKFHPILGGAGWSVATTLVPGAIGGTVDTVPEATASMGVNGEPTPI